MDGDDVKPVGLPPDKSVLESYGLRTVATVARGIRIDTHWAGGQQVRVVSYEPGNGTRYTLIFARGGEMLENTREHLGLPEEWVSIVWLYEGKGIVLAENDGFLHWSYVREKLHCSVPTAVVLAEVFAFVLGRSAMTCEEWAAKEEQRTT